MPSEFRIFNVLISLFVVAVFVLCLVQAVAPRWCWKTFESWKAKSEPTNTYFLIRRIAGIVGALIVCALVSLPIIAACSGS